VSECVCCTLSFNGGGGGGGGDNNAAMAASMENGMTISTAVLCM